MTVTLKQRKVLANILHSMFCHQPHEDCCAYGWEGDNWTAREHKHWLDMTTKALRTAEIEVRDDP